MDKPLVSRYLPFALCLAIFALALAMLWAGAIWWWLAALFGALSLLGIVDVTQTRNTLRRNYPVISHIRYFFEYVRPMLRQYIVESDT
ncbi:MAG: hypothetical protein ACREPT_14490 [Rudaea sp.]